MEIITAEMRNIIRENNEQALSRMSEEERLFYQNRVEENANFIRETTGQEADTVLLMRDAIRDYPKMEVPPPPLREQMESIMNNIESPNVGQSIERLMQLIDGYVLDDDSQSKQNSKSFEKLTNIDLSSIDLSKMPKLHETDKVSALATPTTNNKNIIEIS